MNNTDELKELFAQYQPQLSDTETFMFTLQRKLEIMEYVQRMQRRQLRRFRWAVVAASVFGAVMGAACYALLQHVPADKLLAVFDSNQRMIVFLLDNASIISLAFTAMVVIGSIFASLSLACYATSQSEVHL